MLTIDEKDLISREFSRYEQKRAVCIEALRIVQNRRSWISDQAILEIAEFLEMSPEEVDAVATFYNLIFRKPVGKNILMICDSVSCLIMGYQQLTQQIKDRLKIDLGETTPDQSLTLLPTACLGSCENAPAMMINGEIITNLTSSRLDEILTQLKVPLS